MGIVTAVNKNPFVLFDQFVLDYYILMGLHCCIKHLEELDNCALKSSLFKYAYTKLDFGQNEGYPWAHYLHLHLSNTCILYTSTWFSKKNVAEVHPHVEPTLIYPFPRVLYMPSLVGIYVVVQKSQR